MRKCFILLLFIITMMACRQSDNKLSVDISKVNIQPVRIIRYDQALFSINLDSLQTELIRIQPAFPLFLGGDLNDTRNLIRIREYLLNPLNASCFNEVNREFPQLQPVEQELTTAFKYFAYHFPEYSLPQPYTYISGCDYQHPVIYTDSVLLIGLDNYLGEEFPGYQSLNIPMFVRSRMIPENIAPDCLRAIISSKVQPPAGNMNLLDYMLTEGRKLYLLEAMFPAKEKENLLIGYSREKFQWALTHEKDVWAALVGNRLLYTTNAEVITEFMMDAPFTSGFGKDSPGRIGAFIGWQIIRSYMNQTDAALQSLIMPENSQEILTRSGYKP